MQCKYQTGVQTNAYCSTGGALAWMHAVQGQLLTPDRQRQASNSSKPGHGELDSQHTCSTNRSIDGKQAAQMLPDGRYLAAHARTNQDQPAAETHRVHRIALQHAAACACCSTQQPHPVISPWPCTAWHAEEAKSKTRLACLLKSMESMHTCWPKVQAASDRARPGDLSRCTKLPTQRASQRGAAGVTLCHHSCHAVLS